MRLTAGLAMDFAKGIAGMVDEAFSVTRTRSCGHEPRVGAATREAARSRPEVKLLAD